MMLLLTPPPPPPSRSVGSVSVCRRRGVGAEQGAISCRWEVGSGGDLVIYHGPDVAPENILHLQQQQQEQQQQQRTLLYVREPFETLSWLLRNTSLAPLFDYTMTYLSPPPLLTLRSVFLLFTSRAAATASPPPCPFPTPGLTRARPPPSPCGLGGA